MWSSAGVAGTPLRRRISTMDSVMKVLVSITVNGRVVRDEIDPRMLLVEFVREHMRLTGTHVGCDTSYCGACTLLIDGRTVKSCTLLAVQADGRKIDDRRRPRARRETTSAAGGLRQESCAAMRVLHAGLPDVGDAPAVGKSRSRRCRDPQRTCGQHLPLHRLRQHHRRGERCSAGRCGVRNRES